MLFRSEHVQYACLYWAEHLAGAGENESLVRRLAVFSSHSIKTWVEALGYMGRLDVAERALATAHEWLDREVCPMSITNYNTSHTDLSIIAAALEDYSTSKGVSPPTRHS